MKSCFTLGSGRKESAERAELTEKEWDPYMALPVYRPLLRWTLAEVWAIHERYGIPRNPLYAAGCSRVGCFPCINSNKAEMRLIAKQFPDRIDRIRSEEQSFPNKHGFSTFFAPKTVPLSQRTGPTIVNKNGQEVKLTTIDDVVRWSRTVRGGKQYALDFEDDYGTEDKYLTCPSSLGMCE